MASPTTLRILRAELERASERVGRRKHDAALIPCMEAATAWAKAEEQRAIVAGNLISALEGTIQDAHDATKGLSDLRLGECL